MNLLNNSTIKIFTDGSCNPTFNNGAWAAIIFIGKEKIHLAGESNNTNHQRMELMAVINSIEFVNKKFGDLPLEIYTDSQYVVGITDRMDKLMKNKFITKKGALLHNSDLIESLIVQIKSHTIKFFKVKAHQKTETGLINDVEINIIKYNIEVDKIVRKMVRYARQILPGK